MLRTTVYLTKVSLVDYMSTVAPLLTDKRHIHLSDGRVQGDLLAGNDAQGIAAGRYDTGYPGWKSVR